MVLCKYFVHGNCRFGTKCVNEHFDIKVLLKADVDAAINGNQWPLSSFGPFKEKASIPNFIEDQSFEEIRMLCYGAKKQNFFDAFNQQFTKEVIEAKNKMKMLLTFSKDAADVIIGLYNAAEPTKTSIQGNPFGLSGTGTDQQNSNSLFNQAQPTQGSMFGGATATSFGNGNAANVGNSIFGGQQKAVLGQSTFGSFVGQQQQPVSQGQSIYNSQQSQPQTSIFGGSTYPTAGQQNPANGTSIFGGQQQQQIQPSQPAFGGNNATMFGQQQPAGNMFAQAAQPTQQQQAGGNIFAQAAQQTQPSAFGIFAQSNPQHAPPAFGSQLSQPSPFSPGQQQQQNPAFGQNPQQQQSMGNLFTSQMQQQNQQQPQQPQGIFSGVAVNSPFSAPPLQQQQPQANIFAQATAGLPQQQQLQLQTTISDRTYSKLETLTQQELDAFQADTFELGKVPLVPPPRELIN